MITQFSVFLTNKVGDLLHLLTAFDGHTIRLVALTVVDSANHGIVHMVTSKEGLARKLLADAALTFSEAPILVAELNITQGRTLASLCKALLAAELNLHYAYPLMVRPHGAITIALQTDDMVLAGRVLQQRNFTMLGESDLTDQYHNDGA